MEELEDSKEQVTSKDDVENGKFMQAQNARTSTIYSRISLQAYRVVWWSGN